MSGWAPGAPRRGFFGAIRPTFVALPLLAALSLGAYLLASRALYGLGYPLDDAWIHQAYARNLAWRGEWAFTPGSPSAGSTAPVWAALLAVGYLFRLSPHFWTYTMGWLTLAALGAIGAYGFRVYCPERPAWAWLAGSALIFEWHLVWAAGSGMETALFAALVTATLVWAASGRAHGLGLGLLIGLSAWVRPDGITLLGPAVLGLLATRTAWRERLRALAWAGLGFTALFGLYLLFNRALAGAWWPNTFYAKQAEYAVLRQIPFGPRLIAQLQLPLVGVGMVLVPGVLRFVWRAAERKSWPTLGGMAWWVGYIGLFAWRLPVTYQHGRYLIPAVPILVIWGLAGLADWVRLADRRLWRRALGRAWVFSAGAVLLVFWGIGARAYARDVAIIESEMVAVARWIAARTQPDALVAAHDIGAIGYFAGRPLLDLAGLVSPEVIPFIRDEARLADYLDARRADYLATFPGWYPELVSRARPVYSTDGRFAPHLGGENMVIYEWRPP